MILFQVYINAIIQLDAFFFLYGTKILIYQTHRLNDRNMLK